MIKLTVAAENEGRVDKALAKHFPDAGRRQLAELFDAGAVRLRGKRAKKGDRVVAGDKILLERDDVVVLAKPAGTPSQPLRAGERNTVANAIVSRWPECAAIGDDPRDGGLVHRLDIGTSGAIIAARNDATYRALREAFGQGLVEKEYVAITDGRPVSRDSDAPLVQRGDHVRVDQTDGLPAYTAFTVERANDTHALVRCAAQTGRMHQVRAHLAHVGAPIAGDTRYGGKPLAGFDSFFLHAAKVAFPLGGEKVVVEAPLPHRFREALAQIGLA